MNFYRTLMLLVLLSVIWYLLLFDEECRPIFEKYHIQSFLYIWQHYSLPDNLQQSEN